MSLKANSDDRTVYGTQLSRNHRTIKTMRDDISDELISMIQIVSEDQQFAQWFLSLQPLANNMRYSLIGAMVEQMKMNNEDPDFVAAVNALKSPVVFEAAYKVVLDLRK
jgi:hypothetical protein